MSDCTPTFIPNNLNTGGKSGRLGRRERFLFVGQTKKCWGTLLTVPQPQLHLYGHQGDAKAHTNLQLDGYQARPLASNTATTNKIETTNKTNNHQLSTFEIFCPGKKTYQVIKISISISIYILFNNTSFISYYLLTVYSRKCDRNDIMGRGNKRSLSTTQEATSMCTSWVQCSSSASYASTRALRYSRLQGTSCYANIPETYATRL